MAKTYHIATGIYIFLSLLLFGFSANAQAPREWQLGFQEPGTQIMRDISWFNDYTLIIITVITIFVLALLLICILRFRRSVNPQPAKFTHSTFIEIAWTVIPVLILIVIAIPSFRLLYDQLDIPEYDLTVKATGYQWYWGYEFVDEGYEDVAFDSYMLRNDEREARAKAHNLPISQVPRLLAVDNELVVPVNKTVRLLVTAGDVLHAFAMPAFGIKIDAVPGRLNETWFRPEREGVYYGQCSEICGKDHAFMPIAIRVVGEEEFRRWVEMAGEDIEDAQNQLLAAADM